MMSETEPTTLKEFREQRNKSSYGTYDEYKRTGIDWLERIPEKWDESRLGFNADFIVPQRDKPKELDGPIPWIRIEDFDGMYISESKSERGVTEQTVEENNLSVFPEETVLCSCSCNMGITAIAERPLVSNQTFIGIVTKKKLEPKYVYFLMDACKDNLTALSTGAIQQYLSKDDFSQFTIPLPSINEQKKIGDFLDRETKKIDQLIDTKEKLISLIKEKRAALITNAVTQGLDSDIETNNSGIPGIGEVPESWELIPLKYSSRNITVGIVQKPSQYYVDDGVPALRSLNVNENEIVENDLVYISEEDNKELKSTQLHAGDLVSVRSGDPGTTAVIPEELDGVNCIDLIIIREPDGYIPEFLSFLMNSEASTSQIEAGTEGAAQQHFNVEEVKELVFPKPDIEEQREILDWLSPRLKEIDELEAKIQEGIDRLKEYRAALITEAVTGQIDVRGEV